MRARYVLDASPDNAPASVTNKALQKVIHNPHDNVLYRLMSGQIQHPRGVDPLGMQAYVAACDVVDIEFRGAARDYVASYADAPLLLVQGPLVPAKPLLRRMRLWHACMPP
jgi:hypothetical protein